MVDKYENPFAKISAMIGGDEYLKVSRSLLKSEDATDEEIASSTGLRINMVRKVLYDLFGKGLITGIRVKMKERAGLFIDGVPDVMKSKILLKIKKRRLLKDYNNDLIMKIHQNFTIVEIMTVTELHLRIH